MRGLTSVVERGLVDFSVMVTHRLKRDGIEAADDLIGRQRDRVLKGALTLLRSLSAAS